MARLNGVLTAARSKFTGLPSNTARLYGTFVNNVPSPAARLDCAGFVVEEIMSFGLIGRDGWMGPGHSR